MIFEEFEDQARLYVVGALDAVEEAAFEAARRTHGARAEACINDCRRLNTAFALTLRPHPPQHDAKEKLMSLIRKSLSESRGRI